MFVVSFEEQRIVEDEEVKRLAAAAHPYGEWLARQVIDLSAITAPAAKTSKLQVSEYAHRKL